MRIATLRNDHLLPSFVARVSAALVNIQRTARSVGLRGYSGDAVHSLESILGTLPAGSTMHATIAGNLGVILHGSATDASDAIEDLHNAWIHAVRADEQADALRAHRVALEFARHEQACIAPCSCGYWIGEDPETADGTPMAIYDPASGALNCAECGAEMHAAAPQAAGVTR